MAAKGAVSRRKTEDATEVRRVGYDFIAGFNAGDAESVAALFTEDGLQLAPHEPTARGREAVRDSISYHVYTLGLRNLRSIAEHLEVSGDLATEVGEYAVDVTDPRSGRHTDVGKYARVYRRERGEWRILIDSWSTNAPA